METMLEHCRKHGRSRVILYVLQENQPAIRLYHRLGFRECETSYQYVVPIRRFLQSHRQAAGGEAGQSATVITSGSAMASGSIRAVPIDEVAPDSLPAFPDQWADIASMHLPPENHVLIFMTADGHTVGSCRLSPGFPGCFPFMVDRVGLNDLPGMLSSLERYLHPEKDILKLTFPDEALAGRCEQLGFRLNYRLFKMEKSL
jgi:hypothetical protein